MSIPVASAQPVPEARKAAVVHAPGRQCRKKMPLATRITPSVPSGERRSSQRASAAIGTGAYLGVTKATATDRMPGTPAGNLVTGFPSG